MYVHIGGDFAVRYRDIIGIFDIDNCSVSRRTRDFLKKAQQNGTIINVAEDLPRSFVVATGPENNRVFISGILPATLRRRIEDQEYIEIQTE